MAKAKQETMPINSNTKPVLVFVHGFLGGSMQWSNQRAFFKNHFHVVTPDLPGFGKNGNLAAPDKIADYAEFVLNELTDQGVNSFYLVGHSMGGMIVQEMAAAAPERITKMVLYGTGPVGVLPGRFETMEVSKQRAHKDGATATARRISATWFLEGSKAEAYGACAAIAENASLQAIDAGLDAMACWSGVGFLANIACPTLVLWGDKDRSYDWAQTQKLWLTIQNAALAVAPNCAHAVHLEKPKLFNALLQDFLN